MNKILSLIGLIGYITVMLMIGIVIVPLAIFAAYIGEWQAALQFCAVIALVVAWEKYTGHSAGSE